MSQATRVYEYAKAHGVDVTLRFVTPEETGAEHCQHDNPTIGQELMGDWLADVFGIDQRAVLARMQSRQAARYAGPFAFAASMPFSSGSGDSVTTDPPGSVFSPLAARPASGFDTVAPGAPAAGIPPRAGSSRASRRSSRARFAISRPGAPGGAGRALARAF